MMCPKCHCVDSHAAYCEDRATKDTPMNLPELFAAWCKSKGLDPEKCDKANCWIRYAFEGGAAVLADRAAASAEPTVPLSEYQALQRLVTSQGIRLMEAEDAAPSPAEPRKYQMCTVCRADSAGNYWHAPGCPNAPAEPPVAPVQQEPVAHIQHSRDGVWLHLDFGVTQKLSINLSADEFNRKFALAYAAKYPAQDAVLHPLYTRPSADLRAELAEAKRQLAEYWRDDNTLADKSRSLDHWKHNCTVAMLEAQKRAERAEAERDALKAELAEAKESAEKWKALAEVAQQGWELSQRIGKRINAMRAQASPDAVDETLDVSQIAVNAAYRVNATRVHELGGDSLTIFKEPELLAFVREVYAALKDTP